MWGAILSWVYALSVYVELLSKLAGSGNLEAVLRMANWVSDNLGRSEKVALKLVEIADEKTTPLRTRLTLLEVAKKLGQSIETDQLIIQRIKESTPNYMQKPDTPHIKVFPDTVENQLSYARFYSKINKPEEAEYHFKEALTREEVIPEAYIEYAEHLKSQGKLDEAADQYIEALRENSDDTIVHNNLGILYYQQRKLEYVIHTQHLIITHHTIVVFSFLKLQSLIRG